MKFLAEPNTRIFPYSLARGILRCSFGAVSEQVYWVLQPNFLLKQVKSLAEPDELQCIPLVVSEQFRNKFIGFGNQNLVATPQENWKNLPQWLPNLMYEVDSNL